MPVGTSVTRIPSRAAIKINITMEEASQWLQLLVLKSAC
jgi:hypothetical protein